MVRKSRYTQYIKGLHYIKNNKNKITVKKSVISKLREMGRH